jgi:hybrid cluster-associated redox disulfide protein
MTISKSMKIGQVLADYPEAIPVLMGAGIGCVGCPSAQSETIEEGFKAHGLSDKQIDEIVAAMNSAVKKEKR